MTFATRIPYGCLWCSVVGTVCGDPPIRLGSFLCLAHDNLLSGHEDLVREALTREPAVSVAALVAAAPAVADAPEPVSVIEREPIDAVEALLLRESGLTYAEIGERLGGYTVQGVRVAVEKLKADRRRAEREARVATVPTPAVAVVAAPPGPQPVQSMYDKEKMRTLRRQGVSVKDIASRMGCSTALVYTATAGTAYQPTKKADPEPEPEPVIVSGRHAHRKSRRSIDYVEVRRLLDTGLDYKAVAERMGISHGSVYAAKAEFKDRGIAPAPPLVPIPVDILDPSGCSHVDDAGKRCGRTVKAHGLCAGHAYDHAPEALFRPRRRRVSFSRMREILATTVKAWGSSRDFGARYAENETAVSRALNEVETYRLAFDRIVGKLGWQRIDDVTYEQVAVEPAKEAA